MSAVARIMVARGVPVSGSDAKDLPVMADLAAAGARIAVGYAAGNLGDAQTVVAGSAIRADNPELAAARAAGLPVLHRSEALAATMADDTVVAVAGTHGKSTTTSMITVLLQGAGLDPSFAIGANVPALGVNAAHGTSGIFVAEADESDGSFLNYRPQIAVVTNVEPDHLDYYGTAEAVYASFDRFTALLPADGVLVACADDAGARALAERTMARGNTRVVLYGTADGRRPAAARRRTRPTWRISTAAGTVRRRAPGSRAGTTRSTRPPPSPWRWNSASTPDSRRGGPGPLLRRLAPLRVQGRGPRRAGLRRLRPPPHRSPGRPDRGTVRRRASTRCTCSSSRTCSPGPGNSPREFADALNLADTALVLDIYPAREDPIPGVTSQLIAEHLGSGRPPGGPGGDAVQALVAAAGPGRHRADRRRRRRHRLRAADCGGPEARAVASTTPPHLPGLAPAVRNRQPAAGRQGARHRTSSPRPRAPPDPPRRPPSGGPQAAEPAGAPPDRRRRGNVLSFPEPKGKRRRTASCAAPSASWPCWWRASLAAAVFSPVLAVRTVSVDGTKLLTPEQVQAALEPLQGKPLPQVSEEEVTALLEAAGPGQGRHRAGAAAVAPGR